MTAHHKYQFFANRGCAYMVNEPYFQKPIAISWQEGKFLAEKIGGKEYFADPDKMPESFLPVLKYAIITVLQFGGEVYISDDAKDREPG